MKLILNCFLNLENLLLGARQSIIALQPENAGLEAEILLAVEGAKMMVTRNLWTAEGVYQNIKESMGLANSGLVNDSQGVVKKLVFEGPVWSSLWPLRS